jgi:hypothetical protein
VGRQDKVGRRELLVLRESGISLQKREVARGWAEGRGDLAAARERLGDLRLLAVPVLEARGEPKSEIGISR